MLTKSEQQRYDSLIKEKSANILMQTIFELTYSNPSTSKDTILAKFTLSDVDNALEVYIKKEEYEHCAILKILRSMLNTKSGYFPNGSTTMISVSELSNLDDRTLIYGHENVDTIFHLY